MNISEEANYYSKLEFKSKQEIVLEQIIEYVRYQQRLFEKGESEVSGYDLIQIYLEEGIIKLDFSLNLIQLIENPTMTYTFNFVKPPKKLC